MPEDLAEIYRSTFPALVRFLYRKVWGVERAEDLAQEAFARAVVHKPESARGWLFVVGANMARDDARRAARERRHLTLLKSDPTSAPAADEAVHTETERSRVRAAVEQLTPRDRGRAGGTAGAVRARQRAAGPRGAAPPRRPSAPARRGAAAATSPVARTAAARVGGHRGARARRRVVPAGRIPQLPSPARPPSRGRERGGSSRDGADRAPLRAADCRDKDARARPGSRRSGPVGRGRAA